MENNELSIAYAEVYEILSFMEQKYIDKIPEVYNNVITKEDAERDEMEEK